MTTRYWEETPCAHGLMGKHCEHGDTTDHLEGEVRFGACAVSCPGGLRRELTGVEVVDWCVEHERQYTHPTMSELCRIIKVAIIPLERLEEAHRVVFTAAEATCKYRDLLAISVEPDYGAALAEYRLVGGAFRMERVKAIVDAAVGGRLLVDPPKEEE